MFRRQFLEKLALVDEGAMRRCVQCIQLEGQVKKNLRYDLLHLNRKQQKRNCKYCLKELRGKDRTHKTDEGRRPYCVHCYEKLLGHFGNAQTKREELPPLAT